MPQMAVVERDYPERLQALHRARAADEQGRQRRQGHRWNTQDRGAPARRAQRRRRCATRARPGACPKIESDIDACEVILMLAPETNGHVAVKAWGRWARQTGREHPPGAAPRGREDPLPRHPGAAAQDHQLADLERHRERDRLYNAGYTNVHELIPGARHRAPAVLPGSPWMIAFGEGFSSLSPAGGPEDDRAGSTAEAQRQPRDPLNFITPHQKWGIHSTHRQPADAHAQPRRPVIWL